MKQAPDVRFIGMDPSEVLACRVTVELARKHRQQGRPFAVRVDATLPGHELTVNRMQYKDVYVALREAFDDMKRQIEDKVRRVRGQEKHHEPPLGGAGPQESGSST